MAEDFLEEIYSKSILINKIEKLCDRLYGNSLMLTYYAMAMDEIIPELVEICKDLVSNGDIAGQNIYRTLENINSMSTMSVADEFSRNILPAIKKYVKELPRIDITDDDGLQLFSTDSGFLSIKDTNTGELYHSTYDPMKEAESKANNLFNPEVGEYVFYGCGLGYLPYQLYLVSNGTVHITIYFAKSKTRNYAKLYGVLDWIPESNIDIFIENDIVGFLDTTKNKKAEYYVFGPELNNIPAEIAGIMGDLLSRQTTLFIMKKYSVINMYSNIRNVGKFISAYDSSKIKKKIMVISGGPSVDENIEFIKQHREDMSIICAGTILKKLLNEGIVPDIATIMDAFETTLPQVTNVENCAASLVVGLDAYWKVAATYKGDKYLAAMYDSFGNQRKYAELMKENIFPACTTVTTLAFNLAVYFKPDEIYLIGADFAYPNGQSHASGTAEARTLNTSGMIKTESANGEKVFTTPQMLSYKEDLEDSITLCKNITCYNMSKSGAKIKGTKKG